MTVAQQLGDQSVVPMESSIPLDIDVQRVAPLALTAPRPLETARRRGS
jgi:hypothetical protein